MRNNILYILIIIALFNFDIKSVQAEDLNIKASNINIDKEKKYATFEGQVVASDLYNNILKTELATYDQSIDLLITSKSTSVTTSEGFEIEGTKIKFDNKNKIISSEARAVIKDKENNNIFVDMFIYSIEKNIFTSKGNIKIIDINKNQYNFSEIFIDEKKRKIVGTDVKAFFNQENFKINDKNDPRFFANSLILSDEKSQFEKGVFTYCKFRDGDKCPPWSLQSKKIEHNNAKKTIYYKNATLKVYDFPIFYFPVFSHPDPTVKRASGFLIPSFTDNSNVGAGITLPYFWAIANDKDITVTPKLYAKEKLLMLAEFRQDFKRSNLIIDTSYTQGFKKNEEKKSKGSRSHFFSKLFINLTDNTDITSNLELNIEQVNHNSYFKAHNIKTNLVNSEENILENNLSYNFYKDNTFFDADINVYEDLSKEGRDKYEYLFPYLTFNKNILTSDDYGLFDYESILRIRNYDVDKQTEFFVNNIDWSSNKWISKLGFDSQLKGILKTVNYNSNNEENLKSETAELSGVVGLLSKISLFKKDTSNSSYLTPKLLLRYAPGDMRPVSGGRLRYSNLYDLNKVNEIDVIEKGLSASVGFDYSKNYIVNNNEKERFNLSMGQVINEKENSELPSSTSLDQRFSDLVGSSKYNFNDNFNVNYNFALDQGYKEFNYNELGLGLDLDKTKFNISYLEEKNHIGSQEYIKSDLEIEINEFNSLSFSTKRNLLSSSAEFYNLSYNYINDCLKAGIVYRREFYNEKDIEPENSIMFKITILPFGDISSPTFSK